MRDEARYRFALATRRLAQRALVSGRADRTVELARRLVAVDPYDDAAHRLLVTALQRTGASREAQRAHAVWASLMQELDLHVPAFETVDER